MENINQKLEFKRNRIHIPGDTRVQALDLEQCTCIAHTKISMFFINKKQQKIHFIKV